MSELINNNFGGLTSEFSQYEKSQIVVLPIAFDESVSWQKGAAKGPAAIIDASQQVELYDIETDSEVYKQGIFTAATISTKSAEKMIAQASTQIKTFLEDKKFVVTLGGDHSVAIGPISAHQDYYKDISVLHLDAHADMRDSYEGNKFSHASVMARAKESIDSIVSVGIRSMDVSEKSSLEKNNLFLAEDICCNDDAWITSVVKRLNDNVYLSLDVDVFDSAIIPSTGTPEPGGLNWYQVIRLLKAVCKAKNLIGLDVVELAPNTSNKAPDFLVAKLIYKILSYKYTSFKKSINRNHLCSKV